MNIVKLEDIKLMHRNPLHSCTLTMRKQKEKLRKQSHSSLHCNEKNKILRNKNLPKETKDLYIENPKGSARKLLELINEYSQVAGYKINI